MHDHKGPGMMNELTILIAGSIGVGAGSYLTAQWLTFTARKKRHARENALQKITKHKWNNGTENDAISITRIALKGLKGE